MSSVIPFFGNRKRRLFDFSQPDIFFKNVDSSGFYFELREDIFKSIYEYANINDFSVKFHNIYNKIGCLFYFDSLDYFNSDLSFSILKDSKYLVDSSDSDKHIEFKVINYDVDEGVGSFNSGVYEKEKGLLFNIYRSSRVSISSDSICNKIGINQRGIYSNDFVNSNQRVAGMGLVGIESSKKFLNASLVDSKPFDNCGLENVFTYNKLNDANASFAEINNKLRDVKFDSGYRYYVESNFMIKAESNGSSFGSAGSFNIKQILGIPPFRVNYE